MKASYHVNTTQYTCTIVLILCLTVLICRFSVCFVRLHPVLSAEFLSIVHVLLLPWSMWCTITMQYSRLSCHMLPSFDSFHRLLSQLILHSSKYYPFPVLSVSPLCSQPVLLFFLAFINFSCSLSSSLVDVVHCHDAILLSFLSYASFLPLLSSFSFSTRFTFGQLLSSSNSAILTLGCIR